MKRYTDFDGMDDDPHGEYVLHSDVIALEQENERLRKELLSIATLELFIYGIRRHDQEADFMRYIAQKALKVKP